MPIGLFLWGAREVWTWDVAPLLRFDRLKLTIRRFLELEQSQGSQDRLRAMPEQLAQLRQVMALCESPEGLGAAELLERLGIYYRIGNLAEAACRRNQST